MFRTVNLEHVSLKIRIFYLSKGDGYVLYLLFASEINSEMWDKLHDQDFSWNVQRALRHGGTLGALSLI